MRIQAKFIYASIIVTLITMAAGVVSTQAANIKGNIFTGSQNVDGTPNTATAVPIKDAKVMVQDMVTGEIIKYANEPNNNTYSVWVPNHHEYVLMFSAPGHDSTSRAANITTGGTYYIDAYLPPMDPPSANLLIYAFQDLFPNGGDDGGQLDPALAGVVLTMTHESGQVYTGTTGTIEDPGCSVMPGAGNGEASNPAGLCYFTGLLPGKYQVSATPPDTDWYHMTSEEGTQEWTVTLHPNDPGTELGGYMVWFGFMPKLGQLDPAPGTVTVSGTFLDSENVVEPVPFPEQCEISAMGQVTDAFAVLFDAEDAKTAIATTEADPVTGAYEFNNLPPGKYKMFAVDKGHRYVFKILELPEIKPEGENEIPLTGLDFLIPRFFSSIGGYVLDDLGNGVAGAIVKVRLEGQSPVLQTMSDVNGYYLFPDIPEFETMAYVDVAAPTGYQHMNVAAAVTPPGNNCTEHLAFTDGKKGNRAVEALAGLDYRADLYVELVPAATGTISGFVFNDSLRRGTWTADGVYDESIEPSIQGVEVQVWNAMETIPPVASAISGIYDEAVLRASGWFPPYEAGPPPETWDGGVYDTNFLGHYAIQGLAAGDYWVKTVPPVGYSPTPRLYLSPGKNVRSADLIAAGLLVSKANFGNWVQTRDVISWDGSKYEMVFDGSDALRNPDTNKIIPGFIDGLAVLDDRTLLLSFDRTMNLPGIGDVIDSDIVKFEAASLGPKTSGTFSLYFDAAASGLSFDTDLPLNHDDVDAFALLPDGRLVFSMRGNPSVIRNANNKRTTRDEDLLVWDGSTWGLYLDGSDLGLQINNNHEVNGIDVRGNDIYLTVRGRFTAPPASGDAGTVFVCKNAVVGAVSTCDFDPVPYFEGSANGMPSVKAMSIGPLGVQIAKVTVTGGENLNLDIGLHTKVPIAGKVHGGIFDDVRVETDPNNAFLNEKALLTGLPVGVYDYLGYLIDVMFQPSGLCYPVQPIPAVCDGPEFGTTGIDIQRRIGSGPYIYIGNDPAQLGYYDNTYQSIPMTYTFGQGQAEYVADWSLPPWQ